MYDYAPVFSVIKYSDLTALEGMGTLTRFW